MSNDKIGGVPRKEYFEEYFAKVKFIAYTLVAAINGREPFTCFDCDGDPGGPWDLTLHHLFYSDSQERAEGSVRDAHSNQRWIEAKNHPERMIPLCDGCHDQREISNAARHGLHFDVTVGAQNRARIIKENSVERARLRKLGWLAPGQLSRTKWAKPLQRERFGHRRHLWEIDPNDYGDDEETEKSRFFDQKGYRGAG